MISKWHSNSTQMVHQGLPEKIVQFDRDHLVNIDCSMLALVLPMFRLLCLRVFSLHPFLPLSHEHENPNVLWYLEGCISEAACGTRHIGGGIQESNI